MKNIQYLMLLVYLTTSLFACSDKEEEQVVPEVELLDVEVSTQGTEGRCSGSGYIQFDYVLSYSSSVPLDGYYVHLAIDYVFEDGTSGSYDHEDIDKITENAIEFIGCIKFESSGNYVDSTYKIEVFTSENDQVPLTDSNAITIRENKP